MDDGTERRQALFRSVNERIAEIQARLGDTALLELFCECGESGCNRRISLDQEAFERICASEARVLAAEHER